MQLMQSLKKEFVEVDVELIYLNGEKKADYLKSIKWGDLKRHIKARLMNFRAIQVKEEEN